MKIETLIYIYNLLDEKVYRTEKEFEAATEARTAATPKGRGDAPKPIVDAYYKAQEAYQAARDAFDDFRSKVWNW